MKLKKLRAFIEKCKKTRYLHLRTIKTSTGGKNNMKKDEFLIYDLGDDYRSLIGVAFNAFQAKIIIDDAGTMFENIEIKNRATGRTYGYFEFLEEFDK